MYSDSMSLYVKHGYVYVLIGVAVIIAGTFLIYQTQSTKPMDQTALMQSNSNTNIATDFESFKPMTLSEINVTMTEAKNLFEKVCPEPRNISYLDNPFKINFVYLEPKYPVFKIACGIGPPGIWHEYYAMSENNEVIPVDKDVFRIETPWQAVEYLAFTNHIGLGEPEIGKLIVSTEEYQHTCNPALHGSNIPVSVIKVGDQYLVNMTHKVYTDYMIYPCEFQTFKVSANGTASMLNDHYWYRIT